MENTQANNIINLINSTVAKNYTIQVWVPSINSIKDTVNEYICFKALNVNQQKKLIGIAMDRDIYNSNFTIEFFNIIKDNFLSSDIIPLDKLTILDKIFIALSLRAYVNEHYTFLGDNNTKTTISLYNTLKTLKEAVLNGSIATNAHTFHRNGIDIHCSIPSIVTDMQCEKARSFTSDTVADTVKKIVSETISDELTKFTTQITIDGQDIVLSNFTFEEQKNIIEQLPAFVLEQTLEYVLSYKQAVETCLTYKSETDNVNLLQINGTFFATM